MMHPPAGPPPQVPEFLRVVALGELAACGVMAVWCYLTLREFLPRPLRLVAALLGAAASLWMTLTMSGIIVNFLSGLAAPPGVLVLATFGSIPTLLLIVAVVLLYRRKH